MKGAVKRNRLKRQVRVVIARQGVELRKGLDLVVVIHPTERMSTEAFGNELHRLCKRLGAVA